MIIGECYYFGLKYTPGKGNIPAKTVPDRPKRELRKKIFPFYTKADTIQWIMSEA